MTNLYKINGIINGGKYSYSEIIADQVTYFILQIKKKGEFIEIEILSYTLEQKLRGMMGWTYD